jgi:hypothetical protein
VRIEIVTQEPVRDVQIRALYVIKYALTKMLEERMIVPTLKFFADVYGYELNLKTTSGRCRK